MNDMCAPCNPEKNPPTADVTISKEEAAKMSIGSEVSLHMKGTVKALQPDWDDKGSYRVVVENPAVEVQGEEKEDTNLATMPREKLKKKLQDDSSKEEK